MKKWGMILLLLASLLAGLALGWRLNQIPLDGVVGQCFDATGAYCVLAERSGGVSLLRFSPDGVLLGERPLERYEDGARVAYRALEADALGNLYVLTETAKDLAGEGGALVLSETVRMYGPDLVRQRDAMTLDHPGGAVRAAVRKLEAAGGTVYAVCEQNGRVEVLAADAAGGGAPYSLSAFSLPMGTALYDLAADDGGAVLYTSEAGGLYLAAGGRTRDLSAALGRDAVPAGFYLDAAGKICFQERLSGRFYRLDGEALEEISAPERRAPAVPRGALFPYFILRAILCASAAGLLLWGLWRLLRPGRRAALLKRLLLRLSVLCVLGALALTLTLTALDLGRARRALGGVLISAAGEASDLLSGRGLGELNLLAARGTEGASGLSACLEQAARTLEEEEGLSSGLTLYDSRRQRWFTALKTGGGGHFEPVLDERLAAACASALQDGPILVEDRAGDGFSALLAVPTGENTAVLELRVGWSDTLGAALRRGLLQNGVCALFFAAVIWLGGALALRRGLRPLAPLGRGVLALADGRWEGPVPADSGDELGELARAVNRAALKRQAELAALSARGTAGLPSAQRDLLALAENGICTRRMCSLYAAFDGAASFAGLQTRLDRLGAVVRKNNGVVSACGAGTLLALFPEGVWDGTRAAIEFRECFRAEGAAEPYMAVDADEVTVGVAGGMALAVSKGTARGARLTDRMARCAVGCLMTQDALDALERGRTLCTRYIGLGAGPVRLYELLDGLPYHEKELLLSTRGQFEAGAAAYEQGDLERARACFAAVAGVNRGDGAALYYLARCGEECGGVCDTIF